MILPSASQRAQAQVPTKVDLLSYWNEGNIKAAILDFVERTTQQGSPGFVPVAAYASGSSWLCWQIGKAD